MINDLDTEAGRCEQGFDGLIAELRHVCAGCCGNQVHRFHAHNVSGGCDTKWPGVLSIEFRALSLES